MTLAVLTHHDELFRVRTTEMEKQIFNFNLNLRVIFIHAVFLASSVHSSQIFMAPYNFSLNPDTHQLHTTWEVKGSSISFICAFVELYLMELSWTGESKELSSGNSWAVNCEEGELGDKMVIEVDVTKFRVQPFKSYKVCISLEYSPIDSHLDKVCTHLFSFEKYVPYVPDHSVGEANKKYVKSDSEMIHRTQDSILEGGVESSNDLKSQLKNIENFVRDDYKSNFFNTEDKTELELSLAVLDELNFVMKHSSSGKSNLSSLLILCIISVVIITR